MIYCDVIIFECDKVEPSRIFTEPDFFRSIYEIQIVRIHRKL